MTAPRPVLPDACVDADARTGRAFTLIELLVVVAVIAVLIAILVPALGSASESAKAVVCQSNIRQVGLAAMTFADDHDGHLPGGQADTRIEVDGVSLTQAWFGAFSNAYGEFYPNHGHLSAYWGRADIGGCPSTENPDRTGYGPVDYAYNVLYVGARFDDTLEAPLGVRRIEIRQPTRTVMFHDSARFVGGSEEPGRVPWGYPPTGLAADPDSGFGLQNPAFHGRHHGGGKEGRGNAAGNVAWADGHIESVRPVWYPNYNSAPSAELLKRFSVGDIDPDDDGVRDNDLWDLQ